MRYELILVFKEIFPKNQSYVDVAWVANEVVPYGVKKSPQHLGPRVYGLVSQGHARVQDLLKDFFR